MSDVSTGPDPATLARLAAEDLGAAFGGGHDTAVVMGSGWAPAAEAFGPAESTVAIEGPPGLRGADRRRARR